VHSAFDVAARVANAEQIATPVGINALRGRELDRGIQSRNSEPFDQSVRFVHQLKGFPRADH
jgi:hypothetical protein